MKALVSMLSIATEALFPVAKETAALSAMSPREAVESLPPAPTYGMSVVAMEKTFSIFAYKDPLVSKLISNIKNKKDRHALLIGGYSLFDSLNKMRSLKSSTVLVPIPITDRRRRERGYNQCELIIESALDFDASRRFSYEKYLLIRTKASGEQKKKSRTDRLESASGIFSVNHGRENLKESTIVVIDDVITTGSTMKAALDALKAAGFKDVRGLSLAH